MTPRRLNSPARAVCLLAALAVLVGSAGETLVALLHGDRPPQTGRSDCVRAAKNRGVGRDRHGARRAAAPIGVGESDDAEAEVLPPGTSARAASGPTMPADAPVPPGFRLEGRWLLSVAPGSLRYLRC